jgi:multidrug efflux pump subunit AcrA (membrane-fusion protein)
MLAQLKQRWTGMAAVAAASAMAISACTQAPSLAPAPVQRPTEQTPAAAPTPTTATNPGPRATATAAASATDVAVAARTTPVRRGSISETAQLNGRVTGQDEVALTFNRRVVPATVGVKVGDSFTQNQILVESDNTELQRALKSAQDRVQTTMLRIDQTKRLSATSQRDATAAAEQTLQQALADLARVQAGSSEVEKQAADAAVLSAKAALQKAQLDLDKLDTPATPTQLADAQQAVATATLVLRSAEADAAKVANGADAIELRTAQKAVNDAQAALGTAQADLDRLQNGPSAFQLRAAQREVDRAQGALTVAQGMKSGSDRDAAVNQAKFNLADAEDKLANLKQPPTPELLQAARARVDGAQTDLANAQDKLAALQRGADPLTADKAKAAVDAARLTLQAAESRLAALQDGPDDSALRAARDTVNAAQVTLDAAQKRRDQVYNSPTQADLAQARNRVAAAQAAVDRAQAGQDEDPLLARELQLEQDEVTQIEADIEGTRLRAPFDGQVVSVPANPGEPVEVGAAALIVAKAGPPIVQVTLPSPNSRQAAPTDASQDIVGRIAAQQPAKVQVDDGSGMQFDATVTRLVNGLAPGSRNVQLAVNWGDRQPTYGSTALVQITVSQKQDALLIPRAAIQVSGDRKFVEYLDPTSGTRKVTEVSVGASDGSMTEIITGLSEGQLVLGAPVPQVQTAGARSTGSRANAGATPAPQPPAAGRAATTATAAAFQPAVDTRSSNPGTTLSPAQLTTSDDSTP